MEKLSIPNPEQVKLIFHEVYNGLFRKYKNARTDKEFMNFRNDANALSKKYPYKLCHEMLLEISEIIHKYSKEEGHEETG